MDKELFDSIAMADIQVWKVENEANLLQETFLSGTSTRSKTKKPQEQRMDSHRACANRVKSLFFTDDESLKRLDFTDDVKLNFSDASEKNINLILVFPLQKKEHPTGGMFDVLHCMYKILTVDLFRWENYTRE